MRLPIPTWLSKPLIPKTATAMIEDIHAFVSGAELIEIQTMDQRNNSLELTKAVKKLSKNVETSRKELVKPLNDQVKTINAFFKGELTDLSDMEANLKSNLLTFDKAEMARQAEIRRLEAKAEQERLDAIARAEIIVGSEPPVAPVQKKILPVATKGLHTAITYKASVSDKEAFVRHCLETGRLDLLDVNMSLVNAFARETKGAIQLPGLKIETNEVVKVRV
jgi:hypothetical protein